MSSTRVSIDAWMKKIDCGRVLKSLALTAVFNTVIAVFLTSLSFGPGFLTNFIFSQCIGLSICGSILTGHFLARPVTHVRRLVMIVASMAIGIVIGSLLDALLAGIPPSNLLRGKASLFFQMISIGVMFGAIVTYFFFSRERISQAEARMQAERIQRLTAEKKGLETHLRLLQAQIEPHFLSNSLSNVLSLLDTDLEKGKEMLVDLTRYLRASLSRTRRERTTLGQEMEMVRAYIKIHKTRMGDRLQYRIDIAENLKELSFPPMLIQPLVENAVIHGLEPQIEGGGIWVTVEERGEKIRLVVADTGIGLRESAAPGVGLDNIRERLQSLYNGEGQLMLEENQPSGLKATLEVPHGKSPSDYR